MNELVTYVLNQKVAENGQRTGNSWSVKFSLIDVILRNHVINAIKESVTELIDEKKGAIKEEVKRQLRTKKGAEKFASSLLDATQGAMSSTWKLVIDAKFDELKRDY